jgi:hypothetical protein
MHFSRGGGASRPSPVTSGAIARRSAPNRKTICSYLSGEGTPGIRRSPVDDPLDEYVPPDRGRLPPQVAESRPAPAAPRFPDPLLRLSSVLSRSRSEYMLPTRHGNLWLERRFLDLSGHGRARPPSEDRSRCSSTTWAGSSALQQR